MKKIGLFIAGAIAAIVLIANLGSIVGLLISLLVLYFSFKQFVKSDKKSKKWFWGIVGLIALSVSAANVPAILGLIAAYVLYLIFNNWKKSNDPYVSDDPFTNFEKQWESLKRQ
ncbi:MAG: flagellar basal body rod protein [Bacillaceae bacterium]|jgi:lia operon protein LiaI|uniref:Flagellar basal body rod protein n=3 Tax=Aeribacillus TaxID=1055323 RepID=A0A165XZA1_9BACI|nr:MULTISPECIES: hypothetical protein [Aeribacillus]AXI38799.1 flagellar basal body rod protein [Bacillaceae bacterium ZC4]REJ19692.1 MAG: flagellar basal body rod protein [Bacillaceae bacterium]ASS91329.1 flagellar basal body rod protein [Aeribacillus pallidus]AXI38867.1 flagellar basal body rod protein [Bacillaceae bacterium ZC4]KZM53542.1 flagellar basal body rod protein [Aeribacillus pallidus]